MMRFVRKISRDGKGTATIELALLAPVLATFVIGITDVSIVVGRRLEIEQAAHRAIEKQMQTTGALTVEETIKKEAVCQINGTDVDADGVETCDTGRITTANVTVTYTLECTSSGGAITTQATTSSTTFEGYACDEDAGETPARYIEVAVTDTYTPMFDIHFGTGDDGIYQLEAKAGMRVG
jgi:hypothetical protein